MVYSFLKLIKRIVVIYLLLKSKYKCDANISVLHNNIHVN